MEIIRLSGYILEEKYSIARKHLIPRALLDHGLFKRQVRISPASLQKIIDGYAREAGVRGLEKQIKKIFRKAAIHLSNDSNLQVAVLKDNVKIYVLLTKF